MTSKYGAGRSEVCLEPRDICLRSPATVCANEFDSSRKQPTDSRLDINLQTSNSICFSLHARRNKGKGSPFCECGSFITTNVLTGRARRPCSPVSTASESAAMSTSSTPACSIALDLFSTKSSSTATRMPSSISSIPAHPKSPGGSIITRAHFFRPPTLPTSSRTRATASFMIRPSSPAPVSSP